MTSLIAFTSPDRDILAEFLADKRSPTTRRAYQKDLRDFFQAIAETDPSPTIVLAFLAMSRYQAIALVLNYKSQLIEKGLAEATVNRRLAAVKALVDYARKVGKCEWSLSDIKREKSNGYRDTTGISPEAFKAMLAVPDREKPKGFRDYAILRLLWDNALRRSEVSKANVKDLDLEAGILWILGKGRGSQKEAIALAPPTVEALREWLAARSDGHLPLFITLDNATYGHRLSDSAVYVIVRAIGRAAGITKIISPHRIRHSSITAALDATGGDVRSVQKLSRHSKLDTLMIYDDNRRNVQGKMSKLIADLV
jgi:integrase/recombinase XerC